MSNEPTGAELGKKTAAEMALGLVEPGMTLGLGSGSTAEWFVRLMAGRVADGLDVTCCLLYTSDAADDTPCVDLGGRRII